MTRLVEDMLHFRNFAEYYRCLQQYDSKDLVLFHRTQERWLGISWQDFLLQVKYVALAINSLAIPIQSNIGILGPSLPRWTIFELGVLLARRISVGFFMNIAESNFQSQREHAEVRVIAVGGKEGWEHVRKSKDHLDIIISLDDNVEDEFSRCVRWNSLLAEGQRIHTHHPELFGQLLDQIKDDDIAAIIYTSGTSDSARAVVHTHSSMTYVLTVNDHDFGPADLFLNVLPSAHIFSKMVVYSFLSKRMPIYFLADLHQFKYACQEVKPTVVAVVPRILEVNYDGIINKFNQLGKIKSLFAKIGFYVAHKNPDNLCTKLLKPLMDRTVYASIREMFGGRLRAIPCGGAHLDPYLEYFFDRVGLPILVGYGATEINLVISNLSGDGRKVGTIGREPKEGIEIKLSEKGEILVRGPSLMKEYYKDPAATSATIDQDGWYHTGDVGHYDQDGYLCFERRIRELYKNSAGEYISPVAIESELKKHPLVSAAIVFGNGKQHLGCLLFPNMGEMKRWKEESQQQSLSDEQFLSRPFVQQHIAKFIKQMNQNLNPWERIKHFKFIPEALTVEGGDLTVTMKIRRDAVLEKYRSVIEKVSNE